jgi:hypothetical protein
MVSEGGGGGERGEGKTKRKREASGVVLDRSFIILSYLILPFLILELPVDKFLPRNSPNEISEKSLAATKIQALVRGCILFHSSSPFFF